MKRMKKWIAVLMAFLLCAGILCVAAEEEPAVTDMPVAGLSLTWPKALAGAKGTVIPEGVGFLGNGIYYTGWYYCAATPAETERLLAANSPDLKVDSLFYTFSVGENLDVSGVTVALNEVGLPLTEKELLPIGKLGNWTFWLYMAFDPAFADEVTPEYAEEYAALCGLQDELLAGFTISEPFNEYGRLSDRVITFEGTDLDGNPVSSAELFSRYEVTMVNLWATWCGYCITEFPELQAIHTRVQDKGCAVVGLMLDQDLESARAMVSEYGITYPIVVISSDFSMAFPYDGLPTTFYVNREGVFLETKITGAHPDLYEDALLSMLEKQ